MTSQAPISAALLKREAEPGHHADQRHLADEPGHVPESLAVEPARRGPVGVDTTAAAALAEDDDRQAASLREPQEAVGLGVSHPALGAGQDRVVVGHHGDGNAPGRGGAEHDTVGGSPLDQLLDRAGRPLRGDGQTAVLDERTLIDQVGDVLPGGAPALGVPAFDHLRASLVEGGAAPADGLAQVVADVVRVGARGAFGRAARGARRLGVGDGLAGVDEVADRHGHLADDARPVRHHDVVHLHRLEHDHFGPGGELGARFGQHLHDDARHRGAQRDGPAVLVTVRPGGLRPKRPGARRGSRCRSGPRAAPGRRSARAAGPG